MIFLLKILKIQDSKINFNRALWYLLHSYFINPFIIAKFAFKNISLAQYNIIITGGPSSGKTSIINQLEKEGYFCFPEFIRSITQEAKNKDDAIQIISNPIISVSDPYDFNTQLLAGRIKQYTDRIEVNNNIVFYDRGIPDVLAYMDFFNQPYDTPFIEACEKYVYTQVFLLPPRKEIYTTDQ